MKNNTIVKADTHALSHDGRGITQVNNKTTFVSGGLDNESLNIKITRQRGNHNEAEVVDILTPSPNRVTPPCPHFGVCGGCNLQHLSEAAQLELKQKTLLDQLHHFGKVEPAKILEPLQAGSLGYRRKARLGAKYVIKKEKLLVGFREKASRYLADIDSCEVLHPKVGKHLTELAELIRSLSCYQHIPQVEFSMGDEEAALIFRHMQTLTPEDLAQLEQFGKDHEFHIYLQPNKPGKVSKLYPKDDLERIHYSLPKQNLKFRFHPMDFTQVNLEMNRLMLEQALNLLEPTSNDRVLDLFCGIGNFTLPLAQLAQSVTGVEGSIEMTDRASENAQFNNISNVEFHAANLEEPPLQQNWMKQEYDKILLDPPRAGAKAMIDIIDRFKAKKIVYVSCNPATLARDAGELVHQHNYKLSAAGIMNMFPHTGHVEAIAVFER